MNFSSRARRINKRVRTEGISHVAALGWKVIRKKFNYYRFKAKYHLQRKISSEATKKPCSSSRFFFSAEELDAARIDYRRFFPDEAEQTIISAEKICSHEFSWLFPNCPAFGPEIDWQKNFTERREWPQSFYLDLNFSKDETYGDVREVWELNRHQYFVTLGKAYWLTGNEKYREEFQSQLVNWTEKNRVGFGINWHDAQEASIRAISWIWAYFFFTCNDEFDDEFAALFKNSLYQHAEFIALNLSDYPLTHNHLISEACGLAFISIRHPEFQYSNIWLKKCLAIVNREVRKQIWEEGLSGELSTNYHCFVLDSLLQLTILLQKNGIPVPIDVSGRIESMTGALVYLLRPDGTLPIVGDSDSGRAFRLTDVSSPDRRHYLSTGAVFFKRSDFKMIAGRFHEESFWLLGLEGWRRYMECDSHFPDTISKLFQCGGMATFRDSWDANSNYMFVRGGATKLRHGVRFGHNHADFLSFELFLNGVRIIVDPGVYLYGCDIEWRRFFRKTRAHNTIEIDGVDHIDVSSTRFGVSELPLSIIHGYETGDDWFLLDMSHSGYRKLGITHRRIFHWRRGECLVLHDKIEGEGSHQITRHLHFHSDLEVIHAQEKILVRSEQGNFTLPIYVIHDTDVDYELEILKGNSNPIQGWISEKYGEKTAAPVLSMTSRETLPAAYTLVILFQEKTLMPEELDELVTNCHSMEARSAFKS